MKKVGKQTDPRKKCEFKIKNKISSLIERNEFN